MVLSLGQRLRTTRELIGMTQEQVIEQLEISHGITMSQQTLSTIEHGKRKVDAERELPALATIYCKPIDYFYEPLTLPNTSTIIPARRTIPIDFNTLGQRDKLELAAELINSFLHSS